MMNSILSLRQNKIQMNLLDLETFLEDAFGPDTSMDSPRFVEHAMKGFNFNTWLNILGFTSTGEHAKASESIDIVMHKVASARFASFRCFAPMDASQTQTFNERTIRAPNRVLACVPESGFDEQNWHLQAIFTVDLLRRDTDIGNFTRDIWERCSTLSESTSRTALYGAVFTDYTFRVWKFDRRRKTLSFSTPIPIRIDFSEFNFDDEDICEQEEARARVVTTEYHRRAHRALLRIAGQEKRMMQEDKPQPSIANGWMGLRHLGSAPKR